MSTPFIKGKNCKVTLLLAQASGQTTNLVIQTKKFTVKPNGVEIADDILGADRSDLDYELNFYDVSFECMVRDLKLLRALLIHQKQRDLRVAMADSACGMLVQPNDGTQDSFQVRKFVLGGWEFNIDGRTERVMVPIPGRAQYFDPLPSR